MRKNKSKIILLSGLFLIMSLLWLRQLMPRQTSSGALTLSKTNMETVRQFEALLQKFHGSDTTVYFAGDTSWLNPTSPRLTRDPFLLVKQTITSPVSKKPTAKVQTPTKTPVREQPRPLPVFKLGGIIFDRRQPQVIINSEIWGIGDTIDGFRIVSITPEGVRLSSPQANLYLQISEDERRQP